MEILEAELKKSRYQSNYRRVLRSTFFSDELFFHPVRILALRTRSTVNPVCGYAVVNPSDHGFVLIDQTDNGIEFFHLCKCQHGLYPPETSAQWPVYVLSLEIMCGYTNTGNAFLPQRVP